MSLWNKRLSEIEYEDIDAFCKAGYSEGLQLDYKREIPKDLANLVLAFANTRGGLILLGVEADKTTNQPIWPCDGMESKPGLSERIMQICRDGIYPSIMPEISDVIENPTDPSKVFVVVRIDESPYAPHSVRNGTKVYVRTVDTNHPIELAHIDKIAALLKRRKKPERQRDLLISRHLDRCVAHRPKTGNPCFWWTVLPEFPSEELCQVTDCDVGVFGGKQKRALDGYVRFSTLSGHRSDWIMAASGKHGDLFLARQFNNRRSGPHDPEEAKPTIRAMYLANLTWSFLNHCQGFYNSPKIGHPGLLRIALGGHDLMGFSLTANEVHSGASFIDHEIRINRTVSFVDLSHADSCWDMAFEMMEELFHAFDLPRPAPHNHWRMVQC